MSSESPAVAIARAHVEAWARHDFDAARAGLADDVKVTASTTMQGAPKTDLTGVDAYMQGLIAFAQGVVPGSLIVNAAVGDDRNALLMVTVKTDGAPFGPMNLPGSRLYLLDENGKIKEEQVIFYGAPA
jgi:hypothetical protein